MRPSSERAGDNIGAARAPRATKPRPTPPPLADNFIRTGSRRRTPSPCSPNSPCQSPCSASSRGRVSRSCSPIFCASPHFSTCSTSPNTTHGSAFDCVSPMSTLGYIDSPNMKAGGKTAEKKSPSNHDSSSLQFPFSRSVSDKQSASSSDEFLRISSLNESAHARPASAPSPPHTPRSAGSRRSGGALEGSQRSPPTLESQRSMFGSSSFGPASKRRNSRSALQLIPLVVDSPLDKILRNRRPSIVQDAGSEPSSNFVERYDRLGSPDIEDKPVPGTSKKLPSPEPGFPAPLSREGSWSHPVRRLNLIAPEGSEALVTEQRRHSELYFGEANKKTERDKFKASRRLSVDCRRIVRRLTQRRASEDNKPKLPQWFSKTMKQVKSAGMDVCGLMPEWVRDREAEEELRMLTHSRLRWLASPEVGTTFVAGWLAVTWVALLRGHSPDPSAPPRLPTTAACNLLTACVAWAAQPRGEGVARDWGSALNALMQCSILLNLVTPLLLPAAPASSLWVLLAPLGALAFLYGEVTVPTSALYGLLLLVTCCASSLSSYSLPLPLALPLFNTSLTPPPEEDHGMAIAVLVAGAQMAIAAALVHAAHRMVHEVMRWRSLGALREKQLCQRESNRQLIASLLPPERSDALSKLAPSEWWRAPPDHFPECTFLQMDISGFTELSASITSLELFDLINAVFTSIDEATECIGHIWKVETVGDCYKACAGGFAPCEDHAERAVALGFAILGIVDNIATRLRLPLTVRCGIHTGPATGAFVGTQLPRYLMYGTTCEVAGLLETAAKTCHILCSPRTIASLSRPWDSELFLASLPDGGQLRAYSLALTDSNLHTLTSGPWGDPLKRLISIFGNNSSVFGSNSSILGGNPSIFSSNPSIFGSNPSVFSSPPPKLPPTPTSTPPRQLHRPPSLVLSDLGREPLVEEGGVRAATCLRPCYAESGTDLAYVAMSRRGAQRLTKASGSSLRAAWY